MTKQNKGFRKKKMSRNTKILGLVVSDIERIMAFGLVLGYLDVGLIQVGQGEFSFTLRGPVFWRLTSGIPPYISKPSAGVPAQAYLRVQALLAYLLLVGEAYILDSSVTASSMVWTIGSKWFKFRALQRLMKDDSVSFRHRTRILMLINLAVGIGLLLRKLPFILTAVGVDRYLQMRFYTSAAPLQRTRELFPSKLTLPETSAKLYWLGVVIGSMLVIQQARIDYFLLERGGLLGFSIASKTFELEVLPQIVRRLARSVRGNDDGTG